MSAHDPLSPISCPKCDSTETRRTSERPGGRTHLCKKCNHVWTTERRRSMPRARRIADTPLPSMPLSELAIMKALLRTPPIKSHVAKAKLARKATKISKRR